MKTGVGQTFDEQSASFLALHAAVAGPGKGPRTPDELSQTIFPEVSFFTAKPLGQNNAPCPPWFPWLGAEGGFSEPLEPLGKF